MTTKSEHGFSVNPEWDFSAVDTQPGHNRRNTSVGSTSTTIVHGAGSVASSNGGVTIGGVRPLSVSSDVGHLIPVPQDRASKVILTVTVLLGMMFSCLDMSIVSTALVKISVDLDNDYLDAPWVILAYLLTYMAFSVTISKLSDIYGRRNMLVVSWIMFSAFSILCAMARTMQQLIVGRALQGIGGAGLYSLAQICLVEIGLGGPEAVGAMVGMTLSISYVLGPLLGGVIAEEWHWRAIFAINCPFAVGTIIVLLKYWPDNRRHRSDWRQALAKVDFPGNVLLLAASVMLIFGLQQGGSLVYPWSSATIVCTLTFSAISWLCLWAWEGLLGTKFRRFRTEPIFPIRLVKKAPYLSGLAATFFTGWSFVALVVDIPERLQIINGDSALMAGLHLLPMLGATALGSALAGTVNKRRNFFGCTTLVGCILQGAGLISIYGTTLSSARIAVFLAFTGIYGLGVGLVFAAATMLTTVEARTIDLAAAQGAVAQARVLGGSIGLTIGTIIFNHLVQRDLPGILSSQQLDQIHRSPIAVLSMPQDLQPRVKEVYTSAFVSQMLGLAVTGLIAIIASIGTFRVDSTPVSSLLGQPATTVRKSPSSHNSDVELGDLDGDGRPVVSSGSGGR